MSGGAREGFVRDSRILEPHTSSRPWTPFSKPSKAANTSPPRSSGASVLSTSSSWRKRSSYFFKRSRSDAQHLHHHLPQQSAKVPTNASDSRPTTAHSSQPPLRRKTEPLGNVRNSILGTRRRNPPPVPRAQGDSNATLVRHDSVAAEATSFRSFKSEDEYYKFVRKQSISPPFNFEHITHTAKTQLPALDTVDERDLPREFWAANAHQRPKSQLNGIQADDLPASHQRITPETWRPATAKSGSVSPLHPPETGDDRPYIAAPSRPISRIDESIFDRVFESSTDPGNRLAADDSARTSRHPRRRSSLNAIRALQAERSTTDLPTLDEGEWRNAVSDNYVAEVTDAGLDESSTASPVLSPPVQPDDPHLDNIAYRSRQPLPRIPPSRSEERLSKRSSHSTEVARIPSISLQMPTEHTWTPKSSQSSYSSRSVGKSPSQSSSTDPRHSAVISDTTWEDDVDFIYEQQAESTCNFNWEATKGRREASAERLKRTGSANAVYHAHSPTLHSPALPSPALTMMSESDSIFNSSAETIAERRSSRKVENPHRGVGHRGFLAARKSSQDLTASRQTPTPISLTASSSHGSLLSPVFSVSGDDDRKAPYTPGTPFFAHHTGGINPDFLSDPESCRNSGSTRHTKSSSYGSHESSARPPRSSSSQREGARWSLASASSMPELMRSHSRPRSKLLSKGMISAPLESLPQSPPYSTDDDVEDSTIVPREFRTQPVRNSFVMRRPQTPSDRTILQAAGRTVQTRGSRASPPRGFSQISLPGADGSTIEHEVPGWI